MAVRAEAGDTASSVAHQSWMIAQLNQLAPAEAIEPGRTLIVPRMIFASANVSVATAPILTPR
jgi:hypothetical protein